MCLREAQICRFIKAMPLKTTQILSYFKKANEAKLTLSRPKAEQIGTLQAFFALSCRKRLF